MCSSNLGHTPPQAANSSELKIKKQLDQLSCQSSLSLSAVSPELVPTGVERGTVLSHATRYEAAGGVAHVGQLLEEDHAQGTHVPGAHILTTVGSPGEGLGSAVIAHQLVTDDNILALTIHHQRYHTHQYPPCLRVCHGQ